MPDVARDSNADLGSDFAGNTTDKNFSFTLTTAGLLLIGLADLSGLTSSIFTGVDWNGNPMVSQGTTTCGTSTLFVKVYALYTTDTGTHNFTVHKSGNAVYLAKAVSYKETATTTAGAASGVATASQENGVSNDFDGSITPAVDRSFVTAFVFEASSTLAAGASPTSEFGDVSNGVGWIDSNVVGVITPAGSTTLQAVGTGFPRSGMVLVAVAPPGGGGGGGLSIPGVMNQYRQRRNYTKRPSGLWAPDRNLVIAKRAA